MKLFYSLLIIVQVTACNGQNQSHIPPAQPAVNAKQKGQAKLLPTQGMKQACIRCALRDKKGNLWFGTTGEGVYRYDGSLFTQFTTLDGLSHNNVWSIMEDKDGTMWFGTTNGICRYDGEKITTLAIDQNHLLPKNNSTYYNDWSTRNTVWSMLQDKSGKMWFGTGDGIYCYNGKYFSLFPGNFGISNKDSLHLKMVDCIIEDDHGYIWFASGMLPGSEGLCRYDGKSLINFKLPGQEWIYNILADNGGNLWLATRHNGVVKYDRKEFMRISGGGDVGLALLMDARENVWFSFGENVEYPLWRYDGKNYTKFGAKDGLNDSDIFSIVEDKNGNIWVGTRNLGLYKYNGKTFTKFSE